MENKAPLVIGALVIAGVVALVLTQRAEAIPPPPEVEREPIVIDWV